MKSRKIKKEILLTLVFLLFGFTTLMAQNWKAEGVVTDMKGEPLPGVTILMKGSSTGTSTDLDGKYTLNLNHVASPILQLSCVGNESVEIKLTTTPQFNKIILQESGKLLNELVVLGYGVQKKATLSGSVAGISGKEIVKSPALNVTNSLAGSIAGLIVVGQSGESGSDYSSHFCPKPSSKILSLARLAAFSNPFGFYPKHHLFLLLLWFFLPLVRLDSRLRDLQTVLG